MEREILTNLFTLAEITAAINLAYMNLPATRFAERMKPIIRKVVEPYRSRKSDSGDAKLWKGVVDNPAYKDLYGPGELARLDYPAPNAKLDEIMSTSTASSPTNEGRSFSESSIVEIDGFFAKLFIQPSDKYKRTSDQIISTVCFTLSMVVIVYIALANIILTNNVYKLNWLLVAVFVGLLIPIGYSKGPPAIKGLFFALSAFACISLVYIWNFQEPIFDYTFTIRGLLFFVVLFSLVSPIFLVIAAHTELPIYDKKAEGIVDTLFGSFNKETTEVSAG